MGRAPPPSIPTGKTNLQKTRAGIAPARHKKTPAQRPGFPTSNHTRPTPVNSTRKFPVRQSNRQSSIGNRLLAIGYWLLAIGYWLSSIANRLSPIVYRQSSIANRGPIPHPRTPTGFPPKAQGCAPALPWVPPTKSAINPERVASLPIQRRPNMQQLPDQVRHESKAQKPTRRLNIFLQWLALDRAQQRTQQAKRAKPKHHPARPLRESGPLLQRPPQHRWQLLSLRDGHWHRERASARRALDPGPRRLSRAFQ